MKHFNIFSLDSSSQPYQFHFTVHLWCNRNFTLDLNWISTRSFLRSVELLLLIIYHFVIALDWNWFGLFYEYWILNIEPFALYYVRSLIILLHRLCIDIWLELTLVWNGFDLIYYYRPWKKKSLLYFYKRLSLVIIYNERLSGIWISFRFESRLISDDCT